VNGLADLYTAVAEACKALFCFGHGAAGGIFNVQWQEIRWSCLGLVFCAHRSAGQHLAKGPKGPVTWVGSWATSEQVPEPINSLAPDDMRDATVRQVVHLSTGGALLRVHLSNAFGTAPVHFTSVHIARPATPASPQIDASSDRTLSFSGRPDVTISAGAEYISDPTSFTATPQSDLAVTFHINDPPAGETGHPGSPVTSYLVHSDHVSDSDLPAAMRFDHWFNIDSVDVSAPPGAAAIVALGDSITDGHGATTNGNDRWPDDLARRLAATPAAKRSARSACSMRASAAIGCCSTEWDRTRSRALIAMCWPRRACGT
jgi:hypothetical protein